MTGEDGGNGGGYTRRAVVGGIAGLTAGGLLSPGAAVADEVHSSDTTPVLGANLNGRPHRLDDRFDLLEASGTRWVRAFLDVREKHGSDGRPADDPDVVALRRAAREHDCRLAVSLKWDFAASWGRRDPVSVPRPGSERERELHECATRYLDAIGEPVDVVVLGNEPMWETPNADVTSDDPRILAFTRNLKDHLVEHSDADPVLLAGAFNRLYDAPVREDFSAFYRGTLDFVREDDDVDGVDLHVHFDELGEAEEMVARARDALPDAVLAATEFSPVMRYERFTDVPIDCSDAGKRFAERYDVPSGTTAAEYLDAATDDPVPRDELRDFMAAMPWYNVDHVADAYEVFDDHDVTLATVGFLQGRDMRAEDWTTDWTPFHVNFLYQRALLAEDSGAHPYYMSDYRERTGP